MKLFVSVILAALVWANPVFANDPCDIIYFEPGTCPDLTDDNFVNAADFSVLSSQWRQISPSLTADFDGDNTVDPNDLAHLASYWLRYVSEYQYLISSLPYSTSFEEYQGYDYSYQGHTATLDYQDGWQVNEGAAGVYYWFVPSEYTGSGYTDYQFVIADPNTTISKHFNDTGNDNSYVRLSLIPAIDQKINIGNDANTAASVWFNPDGNIYVLDSGVYTDTGTNYMTVYNRRMVKLFQ